MMFMRANVLLALVTASSIVAPITASQKQQKVHTFQEDEGYWSRLVQETSSMSGSPGPSPQPSSPPTPAPSPAPTTECLVDVSIN